ncbi:MAG: DUF6502 family protein [Acetobacteraceae bacterium]
MPDLNPNAPVAPAALLKAIRRMARPLVRLLIRNGITFPVFVDMMRELFVDVAASDLLTDPRARSDSRISLMTGVHRKEIRRLRESASEPDEMPEIVTINTLIIGRWLALHGSDNAECPRPLPRSAPDGGPSFDALVESVTTDIRPRSILDDWLSQGIASVDENDQVRLHTAAFIPRPGGEEQLFYFARNLHDHLAAAAANVAAAARAPFLDRSVHYDGLTPEMVRRLETAARGASMRALVDINRLAVDLLADEATQEQPQEATSRFNFGVFVYTEPVSRSA